MVTGMMWARIENGRVIELTDIDPEGRFPPGVYDWQPCPDEAQQGWAYIDGVFAPYVPPAPSDEELAASSRFKRDNMLKDIYDPGINMALRAVRMAVTPSEISYAQGKVTELDNFARALEVIPDQPGFPQTIDWPVTPTK